MATIRQLTNGKWHVQVRVAGHKQASKVFRTKAQANAWAVKTEDQIRSGTYLDTRQTDAISLTEHFEWYFLTITPRKAPSALKRERSRLSILAGSKALKRKTVGSLTPESVVAFVDERLAAGMSADTIRKELGTLSSAVDAGIALRGFVMRGNPVEQAKRVLRFTRSLPPGAQRKRRLSPEEEAELLADLPYRMALAVKIILQTALRREELCKILPGDILESTLIVRPGKTARREIPITPETRLLLEEFVRLGSPRPDSISQSFLRSCKRLNIENLRVHDLRHEATSRFFELGLSIEEVSLITGHSDWKSLKRYVHLSPKDVVHKLK